MKIIYTPQDNPEGREEIPFDLDDLFVGEVKLLEKVLKQTFEEIGEMLERGSFTTMLALVWIFRRRHDFDLRLDDLDDVMRVSELEMVGDEDEPLNPEDASPKDDPAADRPEESEPASLSE